MRLSLHRGHRAAPAVCSLDFKATSGPYQSAEPAKAQGQGDDHPWAGDGGHPAVMSPSTSEGLGTLYPASCPMWTSSRLAHRHTWTGDAWCARCTRPCPARLE